MIFVGFDIYIYTYIYTYIYNYIYIHILFGSSFWGFDLYDEPMKIDKEVESRGNPIPVHIEDTQMGGTFEISSPFLPRFLRCFCRVLSCLHPGVTRWRWRLSRSFFFFFGGFEMIF